MTRKKAIYLRCDDAHLAISYTGIAAVPIGNELVPTHQWLAQHLAHTTARTSALADVQADFQGPIRDAFVKVTPLWNGHPIPTTFVLAGFSYRAGPVFSAIPTHDNNTDLRPVETRNEK